MSTASLERTPKRPAPLGFWHSVRLLLGIGRRRAAGQRDHREQREGEDAGRRGAGCLGVLVAILFAVFTHGSGAYVTLQAVKAAQRIAIEQGGRLVVDQWFLYDLTADLHDSKSQAALDAAMEEDFEAEAVVRAGRDGSTAASQEKLLRDFVHASGAANLVTEDDVTGFNGVAMTGLPALFGSLALFAWSLTLILQGEGLELDIQRRRNPMWEWLFTHPVSPAAVFFAEMLRPLATNPVYWSAPLYPAVVYGILFGPLQGLAAAFVIGIPIAISTACLGKALEIVVALRASARWRGALLGVMNWIGFSAGMALFLLAVTAIDPAVQSAAGILSPLARLPWPWLAIFLGRWTPHHSSFLFGMLAVWAAAAAMMLAAIALAVWSADEGISGSTRRRAVARGAGAVRTWYKLGFADNPLYRREIAWFLRDRSALAQAILLPLTLSAFQLFNFRGLVKTTPGDWSFVASGTVVLGTFLLINIGTRALAADAPAIWLALTWPSRVESVLAPKMRSWTALSTAVVWLVLAFSAWREPSATPAIAFIGLAWLVFADSIARKLVARARATDDPSNPRVAAAARTWVVALGTLAFAIGVVSRQWQLVIAAVLFSQLTAHGMWRRFRRRVPFPLDPWSEWRPQPPTLMHAMLALSGVIDGGALATGFVVAVFHTSASIAYPIAYGLAAAVAAATASQMLSHRDAGWRHIWVWRREGRPGEPTSAAVLVGLVIGAGLGAVACLYIDAMRQVALDAPFWSVPGAVPPDRPELRLVTLAVAVLVIPAAHEYLFRGLLYRALDRIWGGWRAVAASAALFALYQPGGFWLEAFVLGVVTALVFKLTGRLWAAVVLHAVVNAMMFGWMFYEAWV